MEQMFERQVFFNIQNVYDTVFNVIHTKLLRLFSVTHQHNPPDEHKGEPTLVSTGQIQGNSKCLTGAEKYINNKIFLYYFYSQLHLKRQ